MMGYEMICCVVNCGQGSRVLRVAKENGVRGGTILLGRGTAHSWLLDLLDLTDVRKEILLAVVGSDVSLDALTGISKEMSFHKPHHGIGFSFPLAAFVGGGRHDKFDVTNGREEEDTMYSAIFTIVPRGGAEAVVEASADAGAQGGTILNARGSSVHEHEKLFAMEIEPEKEVVLTLVPASSVDAVASAIREKLHIDKPGNGVLFIIGLTRAFGLYHDKG